MRTLRTLAAVAGAASLLAIPAVTAGQDATGDVVSVPLAREPDGHLPLEGTPWRLESYHFRDRDAEPGPEVASFVSFGSGHFEGSGGCSKVRGEYGVVGSALDVKLKQLAGKSCAEQTMLVQLAVESGLKKAAALQILPGVTSADDKLVIRSVGGEELLRYGLDDIAGLDWAEWQLASYTSDGVTVPASAEMPAVLSFRPAQDAYYKRRQSGPFSGSTGCNGIVAEFYRHADVISFSELQRTDAPCTPELAAQEEAMTAVLDATAIRLDLPYDRLVLTSADTGERLELGSQTPLEGTTWWLQFTAAGGSLSDQRVTMRLEDGAATGEGPCGPYSASYVTDGVFITFGEAKGARDEACSELRTERALISGLRKSVTVARTSDRLSFHDAQGHTTLSFDRPFAP